MRVFQQTLHISYRPLFWLMLSLHVVFHATVFVCVNLVYLDSDQAFMWGGVADFARGVFREPRFYGQDYNTFLEPLLAVPFRWVGLPVHAALPLATHLCAWVPWLVPALFLYRQNAAAKAAAFLAVPLCLLLPYDVMTGIPRGFVSGLPFLAFFAHSLSHPKNIGYATVNIVLATVALFINPNTLLVSVPCLFYLFLENYRSRKFFKRCLVALPVAAVCWLVFDLFYRLHPEYVVYSVNLEFSSEYLRQNLSHLHERLAHVAFFSSSHAWFTFAAFLLLLTALFIHNRKAFFASLLVPALIVVTLASNKGGDGAMWPFYSFSRSFVGLPLFFALFMLLLPSRNALASALVAAALVCTTWKLATFNATLSKFSDEKNWLGVHLVRVDQAMNAIGNYKVACEKHGVNQLMVSNNFWLNTVLAYGGGAVHSDFPLCFETRYERRYWLREENYDQVVPRFLYVSSLYDLHEKLPGNGFRIAPVDGYGLYLVRDNTLTNAEFIARALKIEDGGN